MFAIPLTLLSLASLGGLVMAVVLAQDVLDRRPGVLPGPARK